MAANGKSDPASGKNPTKAERTSDREFRVTRLFKGPARLVFKAWTTPELLQRWWMPKSTGISFPSCEVDARTGGKYRFVFGLPASDQTMAFFGRYIEVTPPSRLVWTNEESGEGGPVTTVTFDERGGETVVVMSELYPSKEALDEAIASETMSGCSEMFEQLDEVLAN